MTAGGFHPVLAGLARSWDAGGVSWTLLRVPSDRAAPSGDVDVLVAPEDWSALRGAALDAGFVPLPGWDSPRSLILVRYDHPSDCWLVLDVATTVAFRRVPGWESPGLARRALAKRVSDDGVAVPSDGDAFWLLLLHCLLDAGSVDVRYRGELAALARAAGESPIGSEMLGGSAAGIAPARVVAMVEDGRWDALAEVGDRLARDLRRRASVGARLRAQAGRALGWARKPVLLRRRRGVSLALIGPNGVGKSTLAEGLAASLPFGARVAYMGIWKHAGGGPLRSTAEVLVRPLRLWARWLSAQRHLLAGRVVVYDRYVHEAALPAEPPLRRLKVVYFWALRHAVPPAHRVVVVDVPGEVAYLRKGENPADELERERRFYTGLAQRLRRAEVIDATRDPRAVRADVAELVWRDLARRWTGGSSPAVPIDGSQPREPAPSTVEAS